MDGLEADLRLLGVGLYTVGEASRLTRIPQARLRRWLRGYAYRPGAAAMRGVNSIDVAISLPVWQRQLPDIDGALSLGFLDMIEARFVDAFRRHGLSWLVIRRCAEKARTLIGQDHPFSSQKFRTDGRTIFAELAATSEKVLIDLTKSQLAFGRVIGPSLYAGIQFSAEDMPLRWWPLGEDAPVVIDPARAFGQPIVSDAGIPTATLADAVTAEGSVAKVARLYEVEPRAVRAALRFEERLAEAA